MWFNVEYTILINGMVWGKEDLQIECEKLEEAKQIALEYEKTHFEKCGDKFAELMIDFIENEKGEIFEDIYQ